MIDWKNDRSEICNTKVADDEVVCRFCVDKDDLRADGSVRHDPFVPYSRVDASIFRGLVLDESKLQEAAQYVEGERGRKVLARIDILASSIRAVRTDAGDAPLDVVSDEPPYAHGNIVGYPPVRILQKALAQKLAADVIKVHRY